MPMTADERRRRTAIQLLNMAMIMTATSGHDNTTSSTPDPEQYSRITEDGEARVTEGGEQRNIEYTA